MMPIGRRTGQPPFRFSDEWGRARSASIASRTGTPWGVNVGRDLQAPEDADTQRRMAWKPYRTICNRRAIGAQSTGAADDYGPAETRDGISKMDVICWLAVICRRPRSFSS
jgi:hypothetical protein